MKNTDWKHRNYATSKIVKQILNFASSKQLLFTLITAF